VQVSSSERGLVRLFAVDLPSEDMDLFRAQENGADGALLSWPLKDALGFTYVDEDFIELFPVSDLEELGLTGYMVEGLGIAQKDVDEDSARLAAQKGWVLIVLSAAFDGVAQTLSPKAPLRWIGTYKEDGAPVHFEPLPDASAKGSAPTGGETPPAPSSNPHMTLLLALVALPLVALVLGALLFWIL
jgi:hypothetical protein